MSNYTVQKFEDGSFIVKLTDNAANLDPLKEIKELEDLITARETIVIKSNLKLFLDKDLVDEIGYRLARLLYFYAVKRGGLK